MAREYQVADNPNPQQRTRWPFVVLYDGQVVSLLTSRASAERIANRLRMHDYTGTRGVQQARQEARRQRAKKAGR